jgi:hypothetical protein
VRSLVVSPGKTISLVSDYDPGYKADYLEKDDADRYLQEAIRVFATYQDMLYAQDTHSLLIIARGLRLETQSLSRSKIAFWRSCDSSS